MNQSTPIAASFFKPNFRRVVGRFAWKEYRSLAGLAIGVIVLAALQMAVARFFLGRSPFQLGDWMLISAWGAAALFAAAAPVVLFAVEREQQTTQLLTTLPACGPSLMIGKLAAFGMWTLAVLATLVLLSPLAANFQWPSGAYATAICQQGAVAIAEASVWGLLASLLVSQPLLAAVLGVTAAALNSQLAMALTVANANGFTWDDFQAAVPGRLAVLAVVGVVDAWLGVRWLDRVRRVPRWRGFRNARHAGQSVDAAVGHEAAGRSARLGVGSILGRLLWQSWRESWKSVAAAVVGGTALMAAVEITVGALFREVRALGGLHVPLSLLFVPALLGAQTFRRDQLDRSYRFLAEHGGRPRLVWIARQLFWFTPTVLWCAAIVGGGWLTGIWALSLAAAQNAEVPDWFDRGEATTQLWQLTLGLRTAGYATLLFVSASLTAHAWGQFASLAMRSSILAALVALGGAVVLLGWSYVALAGLLSPLWVVAPLAAGALVASWIRCRDWLIDRHGRRRWCAAATAFGGPLAAVLAITPALRWAQVEGELIRERPIHMDAAAYEYGKLLQKGREVDVAYRVLLADDDGLTSDASAAQLAELSAERCILPSEMHGVNNQNAPVLEWLDSPVWQAAQQSLADDPEKSLAWLLTARRLANQRRWSSGGWQNGMTDDQRLWRWTTHESQTGELLKRAIDELAKIDQTLPTPWDRTMLAYLQTRQVIQGDEPPRFIQEHVGAHRATPSSAQWLALAAMELPGERVRSLRALEILATLAADHDLQLQESVLQVLTLNKNAADRRSLAATLRRLASVSSSNWLALLPEGQRGAARWHNFRLLMAASTSYLAAEEFATRTSSPSGAANWVRDVAVRRGERIRLALWAYQLDNEKLPATLHELRPNYLTDNDLLDFYTGEFYQWRPEGWEFPLQSAWSGEEWAPSTPLLWSPGPMLMQPRRVDRYRSARLTPENAFQRDNPEREQRYEFQPTERSAGWGGGPIVLSLLKPEPEPEPVAFDVGYWDFP